MLYIKYNFSFLFQISLFYRFWEFVLLSFKLVDFPFSMGLMSFDVVLFITWKAS
jgi:hypothetical protein